MAYRVGVDVGGTFTDVLLINEESGRTWRSKVPSTPEDQSIGVLYGIQKACREAGIDQGEVSHVLHGTTVATNAVLEGKGARVGLITTRGFRQVLQIARSYVPGGLAGWIVWPKPTPLASLENTIEAEERTSTRGEIIEPLDEDDLRAKLQTLRANDVASVCISLINSFANAEHELRVAAIVKEEMPGIPVSLSTTVLPEMREYERTLTTVANGYVQVQVGNYVRNLEEKIRAGGLDAELALLRSDGGLTSPAASIERPVSLLMSGPAGGVTGATWAAKASQQGNFLSFDMGGTSTDVAMVMDYKPKIAKDTQVGDLKIRVSSVDVRTVGAGGGSIAHVPELTRALRVGPQSAGAVPGPASYGKGGTLPTVTDANVVLGYLPEELAGGEIRMDVAAARTAVASLAEAAGLPDIETAAAGVIAVVNENILGAIRLVSVQQGYDPRDFALIAFGGAGPLHGNALGKLLGSWPVIIPPSPGVLNAYGDVMTSYREEAARTLVRSLSSMSDTELGSLFEQLRVTATDRLIVQGVAADELSYAYKADVRYHGQGFELTIELPTDGLGEGVTDTLASGFDAEHQRLFSFLLEADHEIVSLTVVAIHTATEIPSVPIEQGTGDISAALIRTTEIWVEGKRHESALYDRGLLRAGDVVSGPAIIVEMDSTALVLPDHEATVDPSGCLLINPTRS
ncbi:5-oxoprolinase [Subtercola boreus]|uniref:5-oxoprolinase n=1 Tax=Subtercola boreus TaxID=120213 RepID=A0A3E0VYN7_9MICO|nr:hydantoinase/oxoprolinase family protein [Subtercola boreus]RFA14599.1 5-oxoprolinase [Subtercola boreus]